MQVVASTVKSIVDVFMKESPAAGWEISDLFNFWYKKPTGNASENFHVKLLIEAGLLSSLNNGVGPGGTPLYVVSWAGYKAVY
ncbi:hypothetical protein NYP20_16200 [Pseudomonas sp. N3-W]|uniref:hypothetical protein n=1 Tax=Pseudomonas sp. N3-W TaxID=2975049 RepID=UPI00217D2E62|nr:hypothetical protein [Pseudomonas sp. N3-W]UWF46891.1 hypothetical protein NYP20_16200 [Pseudomonas sp. N3-W]